jgi:hypothetical protein
MKISNTYRTFLLLLLFFGATMGTALGQQDIVMRGSVVLQNSKTLTGKVTYLPDVNIRSLKTTPTMSDSRGQFKLVFANVNYGAKTELTARKTGMMVVNQEILKEAAIVGRADTLKVVMCDEVQFEDNKQRFYSISTENLQRELSRRVAKLQRANAADKRHLMDSLQNEMNIKLTSADEAIAQLNTRSKALEEQLEKLSNDFAAVNLDDASETYRLAYRAFTEGDIHKSLGILYAVDLRKRLSDNKLQIKRRDTLIATMARQNDTSTLQISQDIQACLLAANNHKILFQHREAQSWYETAIEYDSLNLSLLNEYTSYLFEFAEYSKATRYNDIAIEHARVLRRSADSSLYTEGYAEALYYRALIWSRTGLEPQIVKESSFEALPLFEQMAQTDTLKRLMRGRLMAELAQSYGLEETAEGDSLSIVWYKNALATFQLPVSQRLQNTALFYKSIAQLGLGNTYRYLGKMSESVAECRASISTRQQLFQMDSMRYAPYVALAYTMLATTFNKNQKPDDALLAIQQSLRYSQTSLLSNPLLSKKEIIRAKLEWVKSLHVKRQFDEVDQLLDSLGLIIKSTFSLYSDSSWILKSFDDFVVKKRALILEYIKQNNRTKALQLSLNLYQSRPIAVPNENILPTHAIVLILNDRYNEAVRILDTMGDDKAKDIKITLDYFEKRNVRHPDFIRLKNHFNIRD